MNAGNNIDCRFKALGTDISICIVLNKGDNAEQAERDLKEAKKIYFEKEKIFSRFNPQSELCSLNTRLNSAISSSSDMREVASHALQYYKVSGGLFDPRIIETLENIGYRKDFKANDFCSNAVGLKEKDIGGDLSRDLVIQKNTLLFRRRMDFSGIAKGYITDYAAAFLKKKGWKSFLVDSGGDMRVSGKNERGENWRVALEGFPEEKLAITFSKPNLSIATSGIAKRKWEHGEKRFHHIINPKKPNCFYFDLKSVTIIDKKCEDADFWAKVLFLMGKEKGMEFSLKHRIKSLFLDSKGNVFVSGEMKKIII